jgi:hypothetical protein
VQQVYISIYLEKYVSVSRCIEYQLAGRLFINYFINPQKLTLTLADCMVVVECENLQYVILILLSKVLLIIWQKLIYLKPFSWD